MSNATKKSTSTKKANQVVNHSQKRMNSKRIDVLPVVEPSKKREKALINRLENRQKVMKGAGDYAEDKEALRLKYNKPQKQPKVKQQREKEWWESGVDTLLTVGKQLLPLIAAGFGDYEVHSNSLMAAGTNGKIGGEVPYMHSTDQHTTIRHREFLGDVLGSTATYSWVQFPLNPGLAVSFPWASPMSNCFQMYRIKGMIIEFKSLSLEFAAVPYNGFVAIGTQYDVLESPYTGKLELDNAEYACSGPPFQSLMHPIECERSQTFNTELFCRNGNIPSNADLRLYDWGTTTIAVGSQTSNAVIGELWVTYEIDLFKPKLASQIGFAANSAQATVSGCTALAPLGTGFVSPWTGTMPMSIATAGTVLKFGPLTTAGNYYVTFNWVSGSSVAITYPLFTFTNCVGSNLFTAPNGTAVTLSMSASFAVNITGPSATISIGATGVYPAGALTCAIYVSQISAIGSIKNDVVDQTRVWETLLPQSHGEAVRNLRALKMMSDYVTFEQWLKVRNADSDKSIAKLTEEEQRHLYSLAMIDID